MNNGWRGGIPGTWAATRVLAREQGWWLRPFSLILLLFFLGDLSSAAGRGLVPVYTEDVLGRAPSFASMLVSVRLLFSGLAAFVGGALSDAIGQRRVLIIGLSGLAAVSLIFLTDSPMLLFLLSVYAGFAGGAYYLAGDSYTIAAVPNRHLGVATALIFTAPTLGGALGNTISGYILANYNFRLLGIAGASLSAVAFLLGLLFTPEAGGQNTGLSSLQSLTGYGSVIRRKPVLLLGALRFIPTAYWGTASLLFPLLIYRVSGEASTAAYYGTLMLIFASAAQLVSGRLADRVNRYQLAVVLSACIVVASLVTTVVTTSLWGLFLLGVAGPMFAWGLSVPIPALIANVSPPGQQGRTLGFTHICWYAGMITGTQVAGWLVNVASGLPFLVIGVFNVLGVACAMALGRTMREKRGRAVRTAPAEPIDV